MSRRCGSAVGAIPVQWPSVGFSQSRFTRSVNRFQLAVTVWSGISIVSHIRGNLTEIHALIGSMTPAGAANSPPHLTL